MTPIPARPLRRLPSGIAAWTSYPPAVGASSDRFYPPLLVLAGPTFWGLLTTGSAGTRRGCTTSRSRTRCSKPCGGSAWLERAWHGRSAARSGCSDSRSGRACAAWVDGSGSTSASIIPGGICLSLRSSDYAPRSRASQRRCGGSASLPGDTRGRVGRTGASGRRTRRASAMTSAATVPRPAADRPRRQPAASISDRRRPARALVTDPG